jgi:hypothetical protein
MDEGSQKSKTISHMAKIKCEVVRCAEKRNHKATAVFGADESNAQLWRKHKAAISECKRHKKKFTGFKIR